MNRCIWYCGYLFISCSRPRHTRPRHSSQFNEVRQKTKTSYRSSRSAEKKTPLLFGTPYARSQCVWKVTTEIKATSLGETVAYLTCPHHMPINVCASEEDTCMCRESSFLSKTKKTTGYRHSTVCFAPASKRCNAKLCAREQASAVGVVCWHRNPIA